MHQAIFFIAADILQCFFCYKCPDWNKHQNVFVFRDDFIHLENRKDLNGIQFPFPIEVLTNLICIDITSLQVLNGCAIYGMLVCACTCVWKYNYWNSKVYYTLKCKNVFAKISPSQYVYCSCHHVNSCTKIKRIYHINMLTLSNTYLILIIMFGLSM